MDLEKLLREIRIGVCALFVGVLCVKVATLPDFTLTTSKINTTIDNANTTVAKVNSLLDGAHRFGKEVQLDYFDPEHPNDGLYYNIQDDLYNSSRSSQLLSSAVMDTAANINGGTTSGGKVVEGILPQTQTLVSTLNSTVSGLSDDFNRLTNSTTDTLVPLKATLTNINVLSSDLANEMATGGNIDSTLANLSKAVLDADTLIADPNVKQTIANGQDITKHLASSAETLDDVMMPWRKKVTQLKIILGKLAGMLKIVIPLPW